MAGNDVAALVVSLSAQVSKFQKDMDDALGIAERSTRHIQEKFDTLHFGRGIDDLISAVSKLVAIGGLAEVANRLHEVVKSVAEIGDLARVVGVTTDELQGLRFAFIQSGEAAEKVDQGLVRFNNSISNAAQGSGELYEWVRKNHVALKDSNGQLLSTTALLEKFASLIRNAKNPADALNLAIAAFGRQAGTAFVKVFTETNDSIDQFVVKAREAGVVIDREFILRSQKMQTAWEATWLKMKVPVQEFAILFAEQIKKGVEEAIAQFGYLRNAAVAIFNEIKSMELLSPSDALRRGLFGVGSDLLKQGQGTPLTGYPDPNRPQITINNNKTTEAPDKTADSFKRLIDAQRTRIQLLEVEQDTIGRAVGEETAYKTLVELIGKAKQQQIPLDDKRLQQLQDEANRTGQAAQALDDYKRQWAGLNSAVQFAGDQLADILTGLETKTLSLADAAKQLQSALLRALNSALISGSGPLAGILGLQSNVQGGTGGILGALFGGFRAGGGPVSPGRAYVVGERGVPELFIPSTAGQIVPNPVNAAGSFGGSQIIVNNYVSNDTDTRQSTQQGPDGEQIVIDIVRKATIRGDLDSSNRGRYGLRPMKAF